MRDPCSMRCVYPLARSILPRTLRHACVSLGLYFPHVLLWLAPKILSVPEDRSISIGKRRYKPPPRCKRSKADFFLIRIFATSEEVSVRSPEERPLQRALPNICHDVFRFIRVAPRLRHCPEGPTSTAEGFQISLIGRKIRNTGRKLPRTDNTGTPGRQLRESHATERLPHHLRRSPAEASYKSRKITAACSVKSGLNSGSHIESVIQMRLIYLVRGRLARQIFN